MKKGFGQFPNLFKTSQPVPDHLRSNFFNLYADMAWFGILNGSFVSFISVYATRLGASGTQIGMIGAVAAVVNLLLALPAGNWLKNRPIDKSVFWTAAATRIFYLLFIPLRFLLEPQAEVWSIIGLTLIMNIPYTALAVGFSSLFGSAVPPEWRGHVSGVRNAVVSVTSVVASLVCGQILIAMPYPDGYGYQIVFAIGFLGAAMSTFHLWFVHPVKTDESQQVLTEELVAPTKARRARLVEGLRLDVMRGPFRKVVLLMFNFHLFQFLAIPVFPLYAVNFLKLDDMVISFGSAIFSLLVFMGSLKLSSLISKNGNQKVFGFGVVLLGSYPFTVSLSRGPELYLAASILGGVGWALAGGALNNYLLEKIPARDRTGHLAWYNLALNAGILIGSLAGPAIANLVGLQTALMVFAIGRSLAGLAILIWG